MSELRTIGTSVLAALLLGGCQLQAPGGDPGASDEGAPVAEGRGSAAGAARAEGGARPARAPEPTPEPIVVPEGSELLLTLQGSYSSATSQAGDVVLATLADDVSVDGRVVVRAGAEVRGSVTSAVRSGKTKGRARLALGFDRIRADGRDRDLAASGIDVTADDTKGRDAAMIGGGAAGGAIVGGIAKGGKGAAIGGLIGGAAGTAAVLATRGKEVEFPAGSQVRVRLTAPLRLQ